MPKLIRIHKNKQKFGLWLDTQAKMMNLTCFNSNLSINTFVSLLLAWERLMKIWNYRSGVPNFQVINVGCQAIIQCYKL